MSFDETNWSYSNNELWERDFAKCNSSNNPKQSPINIDTTTVKDIGSLQSLSLLYGNSKCFVKNKNNTPTIKYDPNSYIKFANQLYELQKITLHTPSMHTINGEYYDMEMCLYHCANPTNCSENGVIISVLLKRGKDSSRQNMFFSQFINQLPKGETKFEKEIPVSSSWNVMNALPKNKSFFYYEGSYPMPPCNPNWKWIVFEEVVEIGKTNFETFELVIKYTDTDGNIRIPTKPVGTRNIYYQNNPNLITNDKIEIENINEQIKDLINKRKDLEQNNKNRNTHEVELDTRDSKKLQIESTDNNLQNEWYRENKMFIKGILICIVLLIIIFASLKLTKNLIFDGFITNFMENELKKSEIRTKEKAELGLNNTTQNN